MKTNLAVIFGCRSVEHEVSIISAVQAIHSVDPNKYNVIPLYVAKNGEMYTGEHLKTIEEFKNMPALIKKSDRVTLVKEGENVVIKHLDNKLFNKKADILIDVVFPIVHGTNCEDGTIAGPLTYEAAPFASQPASAANKRLLEISVRSQIGMNTLKKLESILQEYAIDVTTPQKIAELMNMSPRNMNRLLAKLEDSGYVKVAGKETRGSSGRPSRLIRFHF